METKQIQKEGLGINALIKIGEEFKIFGISDFMAHTTVTTAKKTGEENGKTIFKLKNRNGNYTRKQYYLNQKKDQIILLLNDCILKADSETNRFTGNACLNFINTPEEIRQQLSLNLNKDLFDANTNINFIDAERNYNKLVLEVEE